MDYLSGQYFKRVTVEVDLGDLGFYKDALFECKYNYSTIDKEYKRGDTVVKLIINEHIEWDVTQRICSFTLDDLFTEYIVKMI